MRSNAYPAYLESFQNGSLAAKAKYAYSLLSACSICPRACGVNRIAGKLGFCRGGLKIRVCSFMPHSGEEPPISGKNGSGTVFFSHCNMRCVYCQNYRFSQMDEGKDIEPEKLAEIMLSLQRSGCHNINLVTPTHFLPQILIALLSAAPKGLNIPLVYNSGGYESEEMIRLLDGVVDIYLTDMRYADEASARRYSKAPLYPSHNRSAVKEMNRQVKQAVINRRGIMEKGLIIRHLVLPENISGTEEIMRFIASEISPESYVSLMSQYRPYYQAKKYPGLGRRITIKEYQSAQRSMARHGLNNGWIQQAQTEESLAGVHIKSSLCDYTANVQ